MEGIEKRIKNLKAREEKQTQRVNLMKKKKKDKK